MAINDLNNQAYQDSMRQQHGDLLDTTSRRKADDLFKSFKKLEDKKLKYQIHNMQLFSAIYNKAMQDNEKEAEKYRAMMNATTEEERQKAEKDYQREHLKNIRNAAEATIAAEKRIMESMNNSGKARFFAESVRRYVESAEELYKEAAETNDNLESARLKKLAKALEEKRDEAYRQERTFTLLAQREEFEEKVKNFNTELDIAKNNAKFIRDLKIDYAKQAAREELRNQEQEYEDKVAKLEALNNTEVQHAKSREEQLKNESKYLDNKIAIAEAQAKLNDSSVYKTPEEISDLRNQIAKAKNENRDMLKFKRNDLTNKLTSSTGLSKKDLIEALKSTDFEFTDEDKELVKDLRTIINEQDSLEPDADSTIMSIIGPLTNDLGTTIGAAIGGPVGAIIGKAINGIVKGITEWTNKLEDRMDTYYQYQSALDTRLEGSDHSFQNIEKLVKSQLGNNILVKQADLMENLNQLVSEGIAQDVEQRALLMTIAEKVVTTFEVNNENLKRLIRLQQMDSTASYMGMEGQLNELLNKWFEDTEYLSNEFDNISAILLDLDSTLNESLEVDYAIQKWMGALSTMGVSSSTLEKITQGLVYLGTGDVNALSNDTQMQTLFALVADQQQLDYGEMLRDGIDESDINRMMRGIVRYINKLNHDSNNIVTAQYQDIFGMTRSDIEAISNLANSSRFNMVYGAYTNPTIAETWLEEEIDTMGDRMHIAEKIDNAIENAMVSLGTNISDSSALYMGWAATTAIQDFATNLGLDLLSDLVGLVKLPMVGIGVISEFTTAASAVLNTFKLDLRDWEDSDFETRSRGSGITTSAGISSGTSTAISFTNNSSSAETVSELATTSSANTASTELVTNANSADTVSGLVTAYTDSSNGTSYQQYQSQISTASGEVTSLAEASTISAASITSAEAQVQSAGTIESLYTDMFDGKHAIMVSPYKSSWASLVNKSTSDAIAASVNAVSESLNQINTLLVTTSNQVLDVHVTNEKVPVQTNVATMDESLKTAIRQLIAQALTDHDIAKSTAERNNPNQNQYSLEDLIKSLMLGQISVEVNNNNFDTAISKYIMEN